MDYAAINLIESEEASAYQFKEKLLNGIEANRGKDENNPYPITAYIGTNEEVEVSSRDALSGQIRVEMVTEKEFAFLKKLLKTTNFGVNGFIV